METLFACLNDGHLTKLGLDASRSSDDPPQRRIKANMFHAHHISLGYIRCCWPKRNFFFFFRRIDDGPMYIYVIVLLCSMLLIAVVWSDGLYTTFHSSLFFFFKTCCCVFPPSTGIAKKKPFSNVIFPLHLQRKCLMVEKAGQQVQKKEGPTSCAAEASKDVGEYMPMSRRKAFFYCCAETNI